MKHRLYKSSQNIGRRDRRRISRIESFREFNSKEQEAGENYVSVMKENLAALQKAFINLATERSQLMHYIEVENLTFYYDDEPVLEDVSYYVDPGNSLF